MRSPPPSPTAAARATSQESLMLDYVRRLERHRQDRKAVHIHLSGLLAQNRRDHHLRIAAGTFDPLVKLMQAQLFVLSNSDLMLIYKAQAQDEIEAAVVKLRFLFSDDPLVSDEHLAPQSVFSTWYSLDREYDLLRTLAQKMVKEEASRRAASSESAASDSTRMQKQQGTPFTPDLLIQVEAALGQADLANLLRRQAVCAMVGKAQPQPVFHELFISIADLRQTLLPSVNVNSNPWLFQQLTETLDRRVLSMLNKHDDRTLEGDISINLNVSTILGPEFLVFDDNVKAGMRGTIVLELQKVDIFADLGAYLFARDFAHDRGYRICVDGLSYAQLPFVDRERLGADLIKLIWDPALTKEKDNRTSALRRIGVNRIVLCRCDNPASVEFGHSVGISLFQGRHIESLIQGDSGKRLRARPRP
ncbi:hypothetical protein [Magnetospirillum molischianum]|uniref:EAL domain-containing protein n=1 Tax=Magnetospirillum molischianum DSM 120 TaxID=1150626 RepID=H8FMJ1_MAGML|nr:hypothetical protein [Magnetospirillum molischianum]CCG39579.1 conserved hypothetical protein [Magnetospirillum molischianum DSM 120]